MTWSDLLPLLEWLISLQGFAVSVTTYFFGKILFRIATARLEARNNGSGHKSVIKGILEVYTWVPTEAFIFLEHDRLQPAKFDPEGLRAGHKWVWPIFTNFQYVTRLNLLENPNLRWTFNTQVGTDGVNATVGLSISCRCIDPNKVVRWFLKASCSSQKNTSYGVIEVLSDSTPTTRLHTLLKDTVEDRFTVISRRFPFLEIKGLRENGDVSCNQDRRAANLTGLSSSIREELLRIHHLSGILITSLAVNEITPSQNIDEALENVQIQKIQATIATLEAANSFATEKILSDHIGEKAYALKRLLEGLPQWSDGTAVDSIVEFAEKNRPTEETNQSQDQPHQTNAIDDIHFICSNCSHPLVISSDYQNDLVPCPECEATILVPETATHLS